MNLVGIIDVWIDTSLKDVLEMLGLGMFTVGHTGEVDIEESRADISSVST
jgi:hypothetical protein